MAMLKQGFSYAFILGRQPALGAVELQNYLTAQDLTFEYSGQFKDALVLSFAKELDDVRKIQNELGGVVKIVQIIDEAREAGQIINLLSPARLAKTYFAQTKSKINFGISWHGNFLNQQHKRELKNLGLKIKKQLKDNFSLRVVETKTNSLTSVQVAKNKLVESGAEIVIIKTINTFLVGKTLSVQDFEKYSKRDFGKPSPDAKSGMLPPKLAQMLINLTRDKKTETVFDPFVGSGIVLQEAMLMGLKSAGTDIENSATENTKNNLRWLMSEFGINHKYYIGIKKQDATRATWPEMNKNDTIIVTEPYMGPPQGRIMNPEKAKKIAMELRALYLRFFENLATNFGEIENICFVTPIFKTTSGEITPEIIDEIAKLGYTRKVFKTHLPLTDLVYARDDQVVKRQINILRRN